MGFPFNVLKNLDVNKILADFRQHTGKVKYKLGAKPPLSDASTFATSDCSGWTRREMAIGTNDTLHIPDGSWNQRMWCSQQNFKLTSYKLNAMNKDGRLRMCFIRPLFGHVGHVWFTYNGWTLECCAAGGVTSRKWNTLILFLRCSDCYVLTDPHKDGA